MVLYAETHTLLLNDNANHNSDHMTGVSYVNELDPQRALHNLKAWVQHNPKYAGLELTVDEYSDGTLMDEVCNGY
jgi:hypothetical protein